MVLVIYFLIFYVLLSISLYLLFPKADVPAIDGLIPGKNFIQWAKIIGRKKWWPLLLLIPIVNIFIFCGMAVDLVRSFKHYKFTDSALAVIFAPAIFFKIAKSDAEYDGPNFTKEQAYMNDLRVAQKAGDKRKVERLIRKSPYKKSFFREWVESIVFAVFAAAFIRMFLIEAFVIPTPSMEGSLLVGDFLFVSKASYGIRTPMTIAMIPLLHNRIPYVGKESYLKEPSLDYHRLPALEDIKRNKPIVFNWPVGDSVFITKQRSYTLDQARRANKNSIGDKELWEKVKNEDYVVRPIDKKDHYIKRCVAVAGDSLVIRDRQIFVNGVRQKNPKEMQFGYTIQPPRSGIKPNVLKRWNIAQTRADRAIFNGKQVYFLDSLQVTQLMSLGDGVSVKPIEHPKDGDMFPNDDANFGGWNVDNFGPIWIPKAGETTYLDMTNIALYKRIISVYENNDLEIKGGDIYINGEKADSYTFKQDYYWAMGDNRHNSEDSRMWGYVPHDHIVGKPLFIWFSTKNASLKEGIRFNRMFKSANVD
ncbi:MAG: signal peptidase I [Bacteroidia bacterium]|nr:signal peptidase I [Bacteroidia bacterium]